MLSEKAKQMIEKLKSPHGENHIDATADPQEVSSRANI